LDAAVFRKYIAQDEVVLVQGGLSVDIFADNWSAKLPVFWAQHWCPGAQKVDAWAHSWQVHSTTDASNLVYINPPWGRMGEVLQKITTDKANAVVVYPTWNMSWQASWHHLPVIKTINLPATQKLLQAGPRTGNPGYTAARYRVKAAVIVWPEQHL
jgi:hypothetical protein